MLRAREERGTALVVVTHDHHLTAALDVEYSLHDGKLVTGPWLQQASGRTGLR